MIFYDMNGEARLAGSLGGTTAEPVAITTTSAVPLTLTADAGTDALEIYDELGNLWHFFDTAGGAQIGGGDGTTGLVVAGGAPIQGRVRIQPAAGADAFRVKDVNAATLIEAKTAALGFFAATPVAKPAVMGAKLPSDTVMASLLTALAALGLITDSTT